MRYRPFALAGILLFASPLLAQQLKPAGVSTQRVGAPTTSATTQPAEPPAPDAAALREEARRLALLSAADRAKIVTGARTLRARIDQPVPRGARTKSADEHAVDVAGTLGIDGDVAALAFLVLMEASKSAREDLKSVMASVKAINAAKTCKTRECLTALRPTADYDKATLDKVRERAQGKLDGLSELAESESMKMQLMLDRYSKFMSSLSVMMRKFSGDGGVASTVIQNMK